MLEGVPPTPESIAEAIATAMKELERLEKLYRLGGKGSICHKYIRTNISVGTTRTSLQSKLRVFDKYSLPEEGTPEQKEFDACINALLAALPLGVPEPKIESFPMQNMFTPRFDLSDEDSEVVALSSPKKKKAHKKRRCVIS